jgi:flagella basal body P-ring formation protein FlgA
MKTIVFGAVFCYVWIVGYHYRTLMPKDTIPAGHVIQEGDFQRQGFFMSTEKCDWVTDPKTVVGHQALKTLLPNNYVHLSDIQ